jgi:3-methyladenine DNA glycosylase AlkD
MRGTVKCHGLQQPQLLQVYRESLEGPLARVGDAGRAQLGLTLLRSEFGEEKEFGALLLSRSHAALGDGALPALATALDEHVTNWATCDSLCGKVLRDIVRADVRSADAVADWSLASERPWRQRASCVAFVTLARHGQHNERVLRACARTVRNPHRFVQLGTGWVLRELWLADAAAVEGFLRANFAHWTREGLRYAVEKMPSSLQSAILSAHAAETGLGRAGARGRPASDAEDDAARPAKRRRARS